MGQKEIPKVNSEALEASKKAKQTAKNTNQIITKDGKDNNTGGAKR